MDWFGKGKFDPSPGLDIGSYQPPGGWDFGAFGSDVYSAPSVGSRIPFSAGYSSSSSSPSFVDKFAKGFLDQYKNQKFGAGSSEDFAQGAISGGGGGGHQVTPLSKDSRTRFVQYHHKDPTVVGGGSGTPGRPGFGEQLASAAIPAVIGAICDIRLKTDIAPLESTEVNDALAEVAFFVKGLRECA
tara:strand:- start:454 stop:1011 length:558 start_codon:yes stop_codon:yes gene_type:complete